MTIGNRFYITLEHTIFKFKKAYYFRILDTKDNKLYVSDSDIAELFGISLAEYRSKMFFNFSNCIIPNKDGVIILTINGYKQEEKAFKLFKRAFEENFTIMVLS